MELSGIYRIRVALIWIVIIIMALIGLGEVDIDSGVWALLAISVIAIALGVWLLGHLSHRK